MEEEDGPDRVLKSMQGLQCLFLGPVCNFLVILSLSVIVPPTAMNRSSFVRVLGTRTETKRSRGRSSDVPSENYTVVNAS
jgi:hypothetical protein